jgi:hypothetical protein
MVNFIQFHKQDGIRALGRVVKSQIEIISGVIHFCHLLNRRFRMASCWKK